MRKDKIIYAVNIADVQEVAQEELGRTLTDRQLKVAEDKIGDQFNWYEAIASVISMHIAQDEPARSPK